MNILVLTEGTNRSEQQKQPTPIFQRVFMNQTAKLSPQPQVRVALGLMN
jgi:hypothetical protein